MKLNFKICSPFFIVLLTVLLFCCSKQENKTGYTHVSALSKKDSTLLSGYSKKAANFNTKEIYDSAFYYYEKSKELSILAKDNLGQAYAAIRMAEIQRLFADYFGSEGNATEALSILENIKENKYLSLKENATITNYKQLYLSEAYNILGICQRELSNFDKANNYYNTSLKIAKDSLHRCIIQNNMASVYTEKQDYNRAFTLLSKLITSNIVLSNLETKARVLNNLGGVSSILGKPNALNYLNDALNIRLKNNNLKGILSSYIQLANYFAAKDKSRALQFAGKAYNLATKIKSPDDRLAALKILMSVSVKREFALRYININDSLYKVRLKAKTEFASIKYESKKTEAENLVLKNDKVQAKLQAQRDKVVKIVLLTTGIFILIIGVLAVYIQKLKHKRAKIVEVYNTESRISKKIHDELANDMFDTMMFAESLQFDTTDKKETLLQRLDKVYEKTRDISRENSSIDTGSDFYILLIEMLARYKTELINVLPVNADAVTWGVLNEHKKITIYRVLQEFMVNMKKHSKATLVVVKFNADDKKLHINYVDNGIGIKKNNFFYKNGLQNAENRIKSINGTITFDGETKGLKISIAIPI